MQISSMINIRKIYGSCSSLLRDLLSIGTTFVVVDCGGGTLDLTTRKLVGNNQLQLSVVTERSGDFLWKCICR
ncbi:unnamed protein product [Rhizophagus irregularis]|nr:unnamed protein product [Rhizophagus irregularis]